MGTRYEIFRKLDHGNPVRITTVATRGEVEQTLHALEWVEPGDYFTREVMTGEIIQGLRPAAPSDASQAQNVQEDAEGSLQA